MEVIRYTELLLVYLLVLLEQNDVIAHLYRSPAMAPHTWTQVDDLIPDMLVNAADVDVPKPRRRRGTDDDENVRISKSLQFIEQVSINYSKNTDSCSKRTLDDFRITIPDEWYSQFTAQTNVTIAIANMINAMYLYEDDETSNEFFVSLARGVIESQPVITGCGFAFFDSNKFPYVYRRDSSAYSIINYKNDDNTYAKSSWYTYHANNSKNISKNRRRNMHMHNSHDEPSLKQKYNTSVTVSQKDGHWTQPYFSCKGNPAWTITYSLPFFILDKSVVKFRGVVLIDIDLNQLDPNNVEVRLYVSQFTPVTPAVQHRQTLNCLSVLSDEARGVVLIDIDLNQFDLNQCRGATSPHMFANSHRCRQETTTCKHIPGGGFSRGNYECNCKKGYYFTPSQRCFNGTDVETAYLLWKENNSMNYSRYNCMLCKPGCDSCVNASACYVEANILIRGIPLGIQSFCMTIAIVLGVIVWRLRKTKVMISSMWILLEILLVGALLLYATVVIQYFEPSTLTCLLIPWCREVGFAVMYGALVLKLYRLLSEFQSRKAHRVHVRDKDLLKYLCCIIVVVLGFMAAWTAVNMDHHVPGQNNFLSDGTTDGKLKYRVCKSYLWDYVIEFVELLFLLFAIYLCYCTRSAPSDYREGRYVAVAIYNETIISTVLYVTRHILWLSLHPDYLFLMYFVRCQLSVTVTLILVLGPKLWFAHRPPDDDHCRSRAYSTTDVQDSVGPEAMKLNVAISSNGDVDVGEINLAEMDPEDIRLELKRLYTQLQVYRTKTMRRDNPHISKRRGGRKQTHRRFSLQAFHHKHKHHHQDQELTEHEMSKTPEDSTNSAELTLPVTEGSRERHEDHDGSGGGGGRDRDRPERAGPTVTFKTGHKCIV